MGFWDREVRSSFDSMFDYDHDGYLNTSEQACQFSYIEECNRSEEEHEDEDDLFSIGSGHRNNDDYLYGFDSDNRNKDDLFGLDDDWDEFDSDF